MKTNSTELLTNSLLNEVMTDLREFTAQEGYRAATIDQVIKTLTSGAINSINSDFMLNNDILMSRADTGRLKAYLTVYSDIEPVYNTSGTRYKFNILPYIVTLNFYDVDEANYPLLTVIKGAQDGMTAQGNIRKYKILETV